MKIQLIRHATHIISYNGKNLLLDPMFSEKGTLDPVRNAPNEHVNNPLTELPISLQELLNIDAIIVTHTHRDHFDDEAILQLPKNIPLFCQPADEYYIKEKGFLNVIPIQDTYTWEGITWIRTPGRHGEGELGDKMGPVSGFLLTSENEPSLYVIGDSVLYSEIEKIFQVYTPDVAIVFAGAAQFREGGLITMDLEDIRQIVAIDSNVHLIVSHMESWNHCVLTREEVRQYIADHNLDHRVRVPLNGEINGFSIT